MIRLFNHYFSLRVLVLTLVVVALLTLGAAAFFDRMFAEHRASRAAGRQLQALVRQQLQQTTRHIFEAVIECCEFASAADGAGKVAAEERITSCAHAQRLPDRAGARPARELTTPSIYFLTATNRAPVNRPSSPVSGA